jgi:hypothetical protein
MEFKVSLQSYRPKSSVGGIAPIFLLQPMRILIDAGTVQITPATQPGQILLKWKCAQSKCEQLDVGMVKFAVSSKSMEEHIYEFACLSAASVQQAFEAAKSGKPIKIANEPSPAKREPAKPPQTKVLDPIDTSKPQFHQHGLTLVKAPATALHKNLIYSILVTQDTVKFIGYSGDVDAHAFHKPRYTMKAPTLGADAADKIARENPSSPEPTSPLPEVAALQSKAKFEVVHDGQGLAVAKMGKTIRKKGSLGGGVGGKVNEIKRISAASAAPLVKAPLVTAHSIFEGIQGEEVDRMINEPVMVRDTADRRSPEIVETEQLPVIDLLGVEPTSPLLNLKPRPKKAFRGGAAQGMEVEKAFPREKTAFKALDYYHVQPDCTHPDVIVFDIRGGGSYSFECPDRRPFVKFFTKSLSAPKVLL